MPELHRLFREGIGIGRKLMPKLLWDQLLLITMDRFVRVVNTTQMILVTCQNVR